jgi:hypothetical protein
MIKVNALALTHDIVRYVSIRSRLIVMASSILTPKLYEQPGRFHLLLRVAAKQKLRTST